MTDEDLKIRNQTMLRQIHPGLRPKVQAVLADLAGHGLRPRIQQAWRSQADQARAYASGHSSVTWSFHNATGKDDTPEALAADILDDDHPTTVRSEFFLRLASSARAHELNWGGVWGLTKRQRQIIWAAVEEKRWDADVRFGWDPYHVEVTGISLAEARAGERP